jgi:hypothetical protein
MMHVVYYTDSGEAFSIGSVLADPMPSQFSVHACQDDEAYGLVSGFMHWNPNTRTVDGEIMPPPAPDDVTD